MRDMAVRLSPNHPCTSFDLLSAPSHDSPLAPLMPGFPSGALFACPNDLLLPQEPAEVGFLRFLGLTLLVIFLKRCVPASAEVMAMQAMITCCLQSAPEASFADFQLGI